MKMNRCIRIIVVIFIMLVFAEVHAAEYIGLFCFWIDEVSQNHHICAFEGPYIARSEMWIICYPDHNSYGHMCAEFAISYPNNVTPAEIISNDDIIDVELGDLESGISACYSGCQTEWYWLYKQTIWITNHDETMINIVEHPDTDGIWIVDCSSGYPLIPATLLADLYINQDWLGRCCSPLELVNTSSSSWGAIKGLFR